ncbi:hypothetical protein ACFLQ0_03275 [Nitrospinota bacterium]
MPLVGTSTSICISMGEDWALCPEEGGRAGQGQEWAREWVAGAAQECAARGWAGRLGPVQEGAAARRGEGVLWALVLAPASTVR